MSNVPGANDLPTRQQRHLVDKQIKDYSELTRRVENDLRLVHICCFYSDYIDNVIFYCSNIAF